jgi:hypothetical protein
LLCRESAHFLTIKKTLSAGIFLRRTGAVFMASSSSTTGRRISIDGWAVGLALLAALLVRVGVLKTIPW